MRTVNWITIVIVLKVIIVWGEQKNTQAHGSICGYRRVHILEDKNKDQALHGLVSCKYRCNRKEQRKKIENVYFERI